ncbi:FG-GAP repeat domain-containing protein [Microbacterium maritypicum]
MPRILATIVAVSALVVGVAVPAASATAATTAAIGVPVAREVKTSLAGFTPGNIISDAVLTAKNTMTEAQIQAFFNSKVSRCLGGADKYGPIVCLKDFTITSVNRPADAYCSGYTGAANESAARIIYRVAQSCNINPQVLIVMLQKEQGLVTHTWPSANRYWAALGQGCPDGGVPCDPNYVGFFHQIYGAARQMQIYMEGKWFTYYAPGKTWNIRYNPEIACGSAPVYVANRATSALYYYTPYQPNAAAMAAGYGEGDGCSAYGNRNFYNYFTDWFGSTQVPTFMTPTLSSTDQSSYVLGVDGSGGLWGYPFAVNVWGDRKQLASGLPANASVMMVGDLRGSGNRDALIRTQGSVSVMRGTGSGFSAPQPLGLDWSAVVHASAAGDMDGDGIPDVLTTSTNGDLTLWRGDDRGGLRPGIRVGWGWAGMTSLVAGIDLNRDGKNDVIARDAAGRLWAYYSDGRGGWIGQAQIGQGWGGMTTIFAAGDFTGDGVVDVAARTAGGDLYLYPGNAVGGMMGGRKIGNGWQIMPTLAGAGTAVTKPRALLPGAGDVDRDGARDVVAITAQGNLNLYRGNGAGAWRGSQQIGSGWAAGDRMITMGDFNGDGYRDLGRITASGEFYLIPGAAGGGYGQPTLIGTGWQSLSLITGGIDYDGDRNPDVIARNSAGHLVYYRGDGRGGWASQATQIGFGWTGFTMALNAGDFDGDGNADLILRSSDAALWLYPTNGQGGWGTPRQIGYGWGGFTAIFSPGDFDGNGTQDVLARSTGGDLYLFRGDGRGGWGASGVIGTGWGGFTALG